MWMPCVGLQTPRKVGPFIRRAVPALLLAEFGFDHQARFITYNLAMTSCTDSVSSLIHLIFQRNTLSHFEWPRSWVASCHWQQLKYADVATLPPFAPRRMLPRSPKFQGYFCAPEMQRTHLVHPIFLVLCGQIWPRCSKPSLVGECPLQPSSPISDLGTHCPRIVDQLVWSKWRPKSKWVRYKPISQALTVGGQSEANINWADKDVITLNCSTIILRNVFQLSWFFNFIIR